MYNKEVTGLDGAIICNLINTHTHTHTEDKRMPTDSRADRIARFCEYKALVARVV